MEAFEFLGGRYNRPEQIMSGPVQAFRAQNAANGKIVFIHRVSTTEAPEEQAGLLKLLTTALVKSSNAKRLVLDFGEESGYWYVVTESEPQCALLREWLRLEIDSALANSAPRPIAKPIPAPVAEQKEEDPGEFTRFLQARPPLVAPKSAPQTTPFAHVPAPPQAPPATPAPTPGEFTSMFVRSNAAEPVAPTAPAPTAPGPLPLVAAPNMPPGEFTGFFSTGGSAPPPPPPQQAPPSPPPQQKTEGDFTRFFKPGLPTPAPKPSPYVQRPSTPVAPPPSFVKPPAAPQAPPPPPPAAKTGPGEFTQMFSRPQNVQPAAPYNPPPPDVRGDPLGFDRTAPNKQADLSDNLFNDKIDVGRPLPTSRPAQSEFTKMFGAGGLSAPPVQKPSVVAPPPDRSLLDQQLNTQPMAAIRPPAPAPDTPPAPNAPSEFTMIMQGGYGPTKGAGAPPPAEAKGGGGGGSPLLDVRLTPANPMSALPGLGSAGGSVGGVGGHVSSMGASASSALGSAHVSSPLAHMPNMRIPSKNIQIPGPGGSTGGGNKKMAILFGVLGVLAVLLILLMVFLVKNNK